MVYRKKPAEVQAIQYTGDNADQVARFCDSEIFRTYADSYLGIELKKGDLFILPSEYVIKDEFDDFFKLREEVFHKNYELK